jgi:hypothetical protein
LAPAVKVRVSLRRPGKRQNLGKTWGKWAPKSGSLSNSKNWDFTTQNVLGGQPTQNKNMHMRIYSARSVKHVSFHQQKLEPHWIYQAQTRENKRCKMVQATNKNKFGLLTSKKTEKT